MQFRCAVRLTIHVEEQGAAMARPASVGALIVAFPEAGSTSKGLYSFVNSWLDFGNLLSIELFLMIIWKY